MDPEAQAKIAATVITAKTKAKLAADSHAQKTAQRQIQFEQQLKQQAQQHRAQLAKTDLEAAQSLRHNRMKALSEPAAE